MLELIQQIGITDAVGIVGFASTLLAWRDASKKYSNDATIDDYLEWLRRQEQTELLTRFQSSENATTALHELIRIVTEDTITENNRLIQQIAHGDKEVLEKLGLLHTELKELKKYVFLQGSSPPELERFESEYFTQIERAFGTIRMLGVPEMRHVDQLLSIAYVSLSLRHNPFDSPIVEKAENVLRREPLLTIRGGAGSGKTTILQWIAIQCVSNNQSSNPWRGGVPFFIPLRRLKKSDRGMLSLEKLHTYSFPHEEWPHNIPKNWYINVLSDRRAVLLIDGVDELGPSHRQHFWKWLAKFTRLHPGNRVYITSRFFPQYTQNEQLWNPPPSFSSAQLVEMTDNDIESFIRQWHRAIANAIQLSQTGRDSLDKSLATLPAKVFDDSHWRIRELCQTPLLCGLICALHWRESYILPIDRNELYERCCKLLLHDRDVEREVNTSESSLTILTNEDKEMLLQRLALDMMRNTSRQGRSHDIEISDLQAIRWIKPSLKFVSHTNAHQLDPHHVLRHLIERTGLLRSPAKGLVDFPHRSFQEYLAACAAGAQWQIGYLVSRAQDDMWSETIVLAAGTKRGGVHFGHELIKALVEEASKNPKTRYHCIGLAAACLEMAHQVDRSMRENVTSVLKEILPPRNNHEGKGLAMAGNEVLSFLGTPPYDAKSRVAFVKTIGYVATRRAKEVLLRGYGHEEKVTVLKAMLGFPGLSPLEIPSLFNEFCHGSVSKSLKVFFKDLTQLTQLTQTTKQVFETLSIQQFTELKDISGLSTAFPHLKTLSLAECTQLTDLSPLSRLHELRSLDVTGCTALSRLDFSINRLQSIKLQGCIGLTDIKFSQTVNNSLEVLNASGCCSISSLSGLKKLNNCQEIDLSHCTSIRNIQPLETLNNCKRLSLAGLSDISNLTPLSGMKRLQELDLSGCKRITNLTPLLTMPELKTVWIHGTGCKEKAGIIKREGMKRLEVVKKSGINMSEVGNFSWVRKPEK